MTAAPPHPADVAPVAGPRTGSARSTTLDSPIGPLTLTAVDGVLSGVFMDQHRHGPAPADLGPRDDTVFTDAVRQLTEWFAGQRTAFDLPVAPTCGTPFQRRVWAALGRIGYGETASYAQLARAIGQPSASRAVGLANGRNPLSIVVPCHRVVGADGSLTGYGGGLQRKRWLLDHERRVLAAA